MRVFIFYLFVSISSVVALPSKLFELKNLEICTDGYEDNVLKFIKFYTIPYSDTEYKGIVVKQKNSGPGENYKFDLKYSIKDQLIEVNANINSDSKFLPPCYNVDETVPSLTGKVYFVSEDYENTTIYQMTGDKIIDVSTLHTVFFSSDDTGVTIKDIEVEDKEKTDFTLFSGLPGDSDSAALFVYDSSYDTSGLSFSIAEDHFYIKSTSLKFKFVIEKGGVTPKEFTSSGFILSPNYPNPPTDEFKNFPVSITASEKNRNIKFQVAVAKTANPPGEELIQLVSNPTPSLKITCGDFVMTGFEGSSLTFDYPFYSGAKNFQISATAGYSVQFSITDSATPVTPSPVSGTTCAPPETTCPTCPPIVCSNTSTGSTCPACPSCPTTSSGGVTACPVTDCSCQTTTTTDISTTTQSSTMSSVTAVFSLITAFLLSDFY